MALVCLGPTRWRMLRRLFLAGGEDEYAAVRPWQRTDQKHVTSLLALGLVVMVGGTRLRLTAAGRAAQELGEVEAGPLTATAGKHDRTRGNEHPPTLEEARR